MKHKSMVDKLHQLPAHSRLLISFAFTLIIALVNHGSGSYAFQFMITWTSFALANLILFWITITTAKPDEIKLIAKRQDSSRTLIFIIVLLASFVSLFAIILLLRLLPDAKQGGYYTHIALAVLSVIFSWILIHTVFTFRYAHLYYDERRADKSGKIAGGLQFPDDDEPDYTDFAYFAFVIGMTFQVSDVEITSRRLRRLALVHGLLSFLHNTVILALSINIVAGLVEK